MRINTNSAPEKGDMFAAQKGDLAALVHTTDITCQEVTIFGKYLCCCFRLLPVSFHHLWTTYGDFSSLIKLYRFSFIIQNQNFSSCQWQPNRATKSPA